MKLLCMSLITFFSLFAGGRWKRCTFLVFQCVVVVVEDNHGFFYFFLHGEEDDGP